MYGYATSDRRTFCALKTVGAPGSSQRRRASRPAAANVRAMVSRDSVKCAHPSKCSGTMAAVRKSRATHSLLGGHGDVMGANLPDPRDAGWISGSTSRKAGCTTIGPAAASIAPFISVDVASSGKRAVMPDRIALANPADCWGSASTTTAGGWNPPRTLEIAGNSASPPWTPPEGERRRPCTIRTAAAALSTAIRPT